MVAIVRLALRRPYTFVVMAILILIFGVAGGDDDADRHLSRYPDSGHRRGLDLSRSVAGRHGGPRHLLLRAPALDSSVNDIEHIESQSLTGFGIVKIYFQPGVDIRTATAQVTSLSQTVLKQLPPGITPPLILNYNASTVPIIQLALSSPQLAEQKLFDLGQNFIRPALATVQGAAMPSPYGGKERQIQIDLDPAGAAGEGPVGPRRRKRDRRPEPDHPGRHDQDRPVRIQCEAERQPAERSTS